MRCSAAKIGLAMLLLAHAASGAWHHAIAATALLRTLRPARGEWQAKGKMEFLWATPVMEYDGLFNEEQLCMFAKDVLGGLGRLPGGGPEGSGHEPDGHGLDAGRPGSV